MDKRTEKAFDFASDATKQLITLSTGVLALTITFAKDILSNVSGMTSVLLVVGWVLYLLSIACGIWTLLALTGNLAPMGSSSEPGNEDPQSQRASIRTGNVIIPSVLQIIAFLIATASTVAFGISAAQYM